MAAATAVSREARRGLTAARKSLSPWLFYDAVGSDLFEQITRLPEYYLTRTERALFAAHADRIVASAAGSAPLTIVELGAGTATKTGILLEAALRRQPELLYQPVDVSRSSLDEARTNLEATLPGLTVAPQLANYTIELLHFERPPAAHILALYIGSSIGNFTPSEAVDVLAILRAQLEPGDRLLLGTDLAPGPHKPVASLLAAYNDAAGVTSAFNRNMLIRLNRELGTDFSPTCFTHRAIWNPTESRIEMHLESRIAQTVHLPADAESPALTIDFAAGETIHTENSYKFTKPAIEALLSPAGFRLTDALEDPNHLFAVTVATAI
ncbi:L-histidine N(alpha)-methyltransferase [Granulicella sp. WH15]|nr:L-histidine N(alpha)-methyltransferase [Granulicella sp. WH15]